MPLRVQSFTLYFLAVALTEPIKRSHGLPPCEILSVYVYHHSLQEAKQLATTALNARFERIKQPTRCGLITGFQSTLDEEPAMSMILIPDNSNEHFRLFTPARSKRHDKSQVSA